MPSRKTATTLIQGGTLLGAPFLSPEEVPSGAVVISGAPYDSTQTSRVGARLGPQNVRRASTSVAETLKIAERKGLIDPETGKQRFYPRPEALVDIGDFIVYPTNVLKTTDRIAEGVRTVVERGGFSVCLGGDHYIEYPSCLGYCQAEAAKKPGAKVGYVHLDGHFDFTDVHPVWGRYVNTTNARRTAEIDVISPSNMAWIGVELWADAEAVDTIHRNGGLVLSYEDVHRLGARQAARLAAEHAMRGCDSIYLSVDVDIVDSGFFPGCAGVVFGAITPIQLMEMLTELSRYPIGAMDVNELSPRLDRSGRSESFAVEAILTICHDRLFGAGQS